MGHFHRLHCQSIVSIHEADRMLHRWAKALDHLAANPIWGPVERDTIFRYRQHLLSGSNVVDAVYPHHPRFTGTMQHCILYYAGYWSGRMRELLKRSTDGEYSPRAWGILRKPLEELERDTLPMIHATKAGNRYVLNLG
jgi:hypothetical protein